MSLKYKDTRCPMISYVIGKYNVDKAILETSVSVNLLLCLQIAESRASTNSSHITIDR